jgi:hypothetical protein
MSEPYLVRFYSGQNMEYLRKQVTRFGLRAPSNAALHAGMHEAKWFYATPYQQGNAAFLDPDFGRDHEPAVQQRKLAKLNAATVRVLVDNMSDARAAEGMYAFELSTPLGDRLNEYPRWFQHRNNYEGNARLLPDHHHH